MVGGTGLCVCLGCPGAVIVLRGRGGKEEVVQVWCSECLMCVLVACSSKGQRW